MANTFFEEKNELDYREWKEFKEYAPPKNSTKIIVVFIVYGQHDFGL